MPSAIRNFIVMRHDHKPDSPYSRFMPPISATFQDIDDLTNFLNAQVKSPHRQPAKARPNRAKLNPDHAGATRLSSYPALPTLRPASSGPERLAHRRALAHAIHTSL